MAAANGRTTASEGVIYCATGASYVAAAIRSAKSLVRHNPGMLVHLFTDSSGEQTLRGLSPTPFTSSSVLPIPNPRSKVDCLSMTPFDRTIFFDTDTKVVADIREVFGLLEKNDMAMAHAMRRMQGNLKPYRVPLPDAFPEFNSGVIVYRSTPAVLGLLREFAEEFNGAWREIGYQNQQEFHDQTPLRELVWLSDLKVAVLPPEYNIRYLKFPLFWGKEEAVPRIYHLKQFHIGWWKWILASVKNRIYDRADRLISPLLLAMGGNAIGAARRKKRVAIKRAKRSG